MRTRRCNNNRDDRKFAIYTRGGQLLIALTKLQLRSAKADLN